MELIDTEKYYKDCTLCPRMCHADRYSGQKGFCNMGSSLTAAKAYKHMWEEPCITGTEGSGTVFFSGCNMKCIYCQNSEISHNGFGCVIDAERLAGIFLELQDKKASNINLVTGTCFIPHIRNAIIIAKNAGLYIPVIFNCGGYESVEALRLLEGLIDIYMPDVKYSSDDLSKDLSKAPDYFETAKKALGEMFRQTGPVRYDNNKMMKSGILARHLILPGCCGDSKRILRYLHEAYGNDICISIMNQYTPMPAVKDHPLLKRKVSDDEYKRVLDFAEKIGIENGFIQYGEAASESFIPSWDLEGIKASPVPPCT